MRRGCVAWILGMALDKKYIWLRKLLARLVWVPLGMVFVLFLVSNRQPVAISLDPLSTTNPLIVTPALPLWLWLTASLLFGFFAGAVGMWVSARNGRIKSNAAKRELKKLKRELADGESGETLPTLKTS